MSELANQPDNWPTRKASVAATLASIVSPLMLIVSFHIGPSVLPPEIAEAYGTVIYGLVSVAVSLIATIMPRVGAAWWVRDRLNDPIGEDFGDDE